MTYKFVIIFFLADFSELILSVLFKLTIKCMNKNKKKRAY